MTGSDGNDQQLKRRRSRAAVRSTLAVLLVVSGVVAAAIAFDSVSVCDRQVTKAGRPVDVCRHLQATDPPVLAGGVLLLLALAVLVDFNEIAFLGVSLKRNLQDAKAAADNAQLAKEGAEQAQAKAAEAAKSAEDAAGFAQGAQASAASIGELIRATQALEGSRGGSSSRSISDVEGQVRNLAAKYDAIRDEQDPGDKRTEQMTGVVAELIALFSSTPGDLAARAAVWLGEPDRGVRLAAYAYLFTYPVVALTEPVAQTALREDKPFGQYWGLCALHRQLEVRPELDRNQRRALEQLLRKVGAGTDRGHEIQEILRITQDD